MKRTEWNSSINLESGKLLEDGEHNRRSNSNVRQEDIVFVYGTLMRGEYNHYILKKAVFLGEAETRPTFKLYDLGSFPAMVAGGSNGIKGEIYSVTPNILNQLDSLEGHPNWYERMVIDLCSRVKAYTYIMPEKFVRGRSEIISGDWRNR